MCIRTKYPTCSVVMAVYHADKSEWFCEAIDSILNQTVRSNDIVIVRDGPVSPNLESTLKEYEKLYKEIQIIRLDKNKGLGNALNIGIEAAKNELIARMDSDDINLLNRFEFQIAEFNKGRNLDILGCQIAEFKTTSDKVTSHRIVPSKHDDIVRYARRRSPFNHPTVMYRKKFICKCAGYNNELMRSEDYDLWLRAISAGAITGNLDNILLTYRRNPDNIARKSSWKQTREIISVHFLALRRKDISIIDFIITSFGRIIVFILPAWAKEVFYRNVLRNRK